MVLVGIRLGRALSMVMVVVLPLELAFPFSLSSSTSIRIDTWLRCVVQETSQTLLLRLVRFSNTIYAELFVTIPRASPFSVFRLLLANQKVHFLCIFSSSFFYFSFFYFSFSSCSFFFLSAFCFFIISFPLEPHLGESDTRRNNEIIIDRVALLSTNGKKRVESERMIFTERMN